MFTSIRCRSENTSKMASNYASLEDNICPICLYIFIQPVTMPCEHELCLACFKQNVEEANFCCPMCRTRISTWARRAVRNKTLVNENRWKFIQENFPEQVQNRLEGNEEEDEEMKALNVSIKLSEPGEIRTEYEQQLKQLQAQRLEERRRELEASERLISQLQKEELRKQEELDVIAKQDEELARKLSQTDVNSPVGIEQRLRGSGSRSSNSDDMHGSNSERSRSNCESMETFIHKMRTENNMSKSPYPYRCLTPVGTGKLCVEKDKVLMMEEKFRLQKIKRDKNLITTQDIANMEEQFKLQKARPTSNTEVIDIDHLSRGSESNISMGMTHVVSNSNLNQSEILDQMSAGLDVSVNIIDTNRESSDIIVLSPSPEPFEETEDIGPEIRNTVMKSATSTTSSSCSFKSAQNEIAERSLSAQSSDSISQELTHFRPIRSCPLTPPRKLPSGKVIEPQLIRTTPRNLSKSGLGSPIETNLSDIDAGSPIMQRRLSELAEERKDKVLRLSKQTSTGRDAENRNPDSIDEDSSSVNPVARRNLSCSRSVDFKDISNSPIHTKRKMEEDVFEESPAKKKLIIPLVPDLEENYISEPPVLPVSKHLPTNSIRDRLSRSKKSKSSKVRYTSGGNGDGMCSPQVSIMKWMKRADDVKNGVGDYFIGGNRDEVDGDRKWADDQEGESLLKSLKHKVGVTRNEIHCKDGLVVHNTRSRRNRKSAQKEDFIYDESRAVRRKCSVNKFEGNDSSCDGFCSDGNSESSVESSDVRPVTKKMKSEESNYENIANNPCGSEPKFKPKPTLKRTKQSKRSRAVTNKVKSNKPVKTMHDFFSKNGTSQVKEPSQSVDNELSEMTQEERDRKMAETLQKQFELEAKLHLNSLRFKGTSDEYSFRTNRRAKNLSL